MFLPWIEWCIFFHFHFCAFLLSWNHGRNTQTCEKIQTEPQNRVLLKAGLLRVMMSHRIVELLFICREYVLRIKSYVMVHNGWESLCLFFCIFISFKFTVSFLSFHLVPFYDGLSASFSSLSCQLVIPCDIIVCKAITQSYVELILL